MSRFSVRKPYTVFVAVVAILVFGIISYTKMVPDLLPNMDYPYVILVTTYPGATPEEVETKVTRPLEQAMATLNNIETLSSTSAENYSMIMLEFEQDTSMDTATVDILQAIQSVSGSWEDAVGTPNIIRINPSMLPVMVAALDSEDMDRYELCQFAQDTLIPALEGTTGLASIATGGLVERTLTVTLNQDKMDATNARVEEALAGLALPEGIELEYSGERETIMDAMKDLVELLAVGVLLVYLVMVAQFQNLKAPFIVMFTIPLAFTGGFLALLLCGMELNVLSMLGMIMLVGIIVNNGIVLVDYINQLRIGGMELHEAIAEAAVTRLRPILMTSITTILGLVVMLVYDKEADYKMIDRKPRYSTVLTPKQPTND